jgi:hypothetical protein
MLQTREKPDLSPFLAQVESEKLRAVAHAWDQARQGRQMPSFKALRPSAIAAQLPIIWIYSYDRETRRFTGRLAGDRIAQGFGKSFRGIALEDVHTPESFQMVHGVLSRVVQEPAGFRSGGTLFYQDGKTGIGERIILPLSDDGVQGDGILGASDYTMQGAPSGRPVEPVREGERWVSLN